jgi:Flp pilus assembly protein TadD
MTLAPAAAEAGFLEGIAIAETGDLDAAIPVLQKSACADGSPSTPLAQAILGTLLFRQGHFDTAAAWWQRLAPDRRAAWRLAEVLGNTQLLGALEEFNAGRFESAADRFRQAGKLGCRDRRLGGMLLLSLFRAAQQSIADMPNADILAAESPHVIEATLIETPAAEAGS